MPDDVQSLAILFADVCDSTALYEAEGDDRARRLIADCIAGLIAIVDAQGGRTVKTMGDGIMCTFATADVALMAAIAMQEAQEGKGMTLRAGFHFGPTIEKERDVFGDAVNVASRMASLAKPGEIILTGDSVDQLSPFLRMSTRFLDRTTVKGRQELIDIYTMASVEDDLTVMPSAFRRPETAASRLVLGYLGEQVSIVERVRKFVIGRDANCDLVVTPSYVSRQHATIEFQRGKYYLFDHSANGTYAIFGNDEPVFVKRENLQLHGSGVISLGRSPERDPTHRIHFQCTAGE